MREEKEGETQGGREGRVIGETKETMREEKEGEKQGRGGGLKG